MYLDSNNAYILSLAYKITGEDKYAEKALYFIKSWSEKNKEYKGFGFDVKLDPSLTCTYKCANWYNQTGADLYMTTNGVALIQSAILLRDYKGFTKELKNTFSDWVRNVYRKSTDNYLYNNENFDDNSGSWSNYGVIMTHVWFNDKKALLLDVEYMKKNIITQISADGILKSEQSRGTKAMWYTYYSLAPMTAASMVLYNETGVDLFHYKNSTGSTIETALDTYFLQTVNPKLYPWVNGTIGTLPSRSKWGGNMFEGLATFLNKPEWKNWLGNQNVMYFTSHTAWSVPSLMRN